MSVYEDTKRNYRCSICGLPTTQTRAWAYHPQASQYDALFGARGPRNDDFLAKEDCSKLEKQTSWWSDVYLLHDPDDEVDKLCPDIAMPDADRTPREPGAMRADIQEYKARWVLDGIFYFGVSGVVTTVDMIGRQSDRHRAYIPTHAICLEMAKRVFSSTKAYLKDMRGLWTALRWRYGIERRNLAFNHGANYTLVDNEFYTPPWSWWFDSLSPSSDRSLFSRLCSYTHSWPGPSKDVPLVNYVHTFGSNPLDIENLTENILSNLRECRHNTLLRREAEGFKRRLNSLPVELWDAICAEISSPRDLPRVATYILPQGFWKDLLKSQTALPWLWDIDLALIDAKAAEPCPGGSGFEWDWELLVRQLSRGVDFGIRTDVPPPPHFRFERFQETDQSVEWFWTCTGYSDDLAHVPAGLHNRRRIWQLLEEMFVGDRLPKPNEFHNESREHCLIMPWTKSGDIANEPTWVPSIWINHLHRQIGGRIYEVEGLNWFDRPSSQYWQMPQRSDQGLIKVATVEEMYNALRKKGYPL
ncbi:hypothetical protein F4776DRAFT_616864 [Hypoxylon sp. NC0597]|nr:hypothetical protein F4776DRAFT_616864 [Hypoxylon sp. NC0597]